MKSKHVKNNSEVKAAEVQMIKLGQDVHAAQVTVALQMDGSMPQPAQKIPIERHLDWIRAQKAK